MSMDRRVRQHFDEDSARFDGIYEESKPFFQRFVDSRIRGVVLERLKLTRALAPAQGAWSVLDVGCGSGRYDVALAKDGAARAVGLDFAPKMIEIARADAEKNGVQDRCEFHVAEFLEFASTERFDLVLAMGYFDYIADPLPHLKRMVGHTSGHLLASFPKRMEWRVPIRVVRFALARGYVRFFSRSEVERLASAAGIGAGHSYVLDFGRDYILVIRP
jgi:2-polyprenyl-3-methyl-5-hydroxy-6-metoxy-1,4-benzoquinol methylase